MKNRGVERNREREKLLKEFRKSSVPDMDRERATTSVYLSN